MVEKYQSSFLPLKTRAVILFIIFSVFQELPSPNLTLKLAPRDKVIVTPVNFSIFPRP